MNTLSLSSPVVCRRAVPGDQADVFEFCKGIWEGDDYVPAVWEQWLNDRDGILAVAEYEGHVIGCTKVSRISKGQWWLEGFRVDPQYQGLKVGSQLHNHVTDWWIENGEGTLRLMTDAGNFTVHHLCNKTGFVKVDEVCAYRAAPLEEPDGSFTSITNPPAAAVFARKSESIGRTHGLTDLGWRICKPDQEVLESYTNQNAESEHEFYWWKDQQGLFSAWEDEEEGIKTLFLGPVACAQKDMPALLLDVRRWAARRKCNYIFQIVFDVPEIVSQYIAAGFEKKWKRSNAFVFEKTHPTGA